MFYQVSLSSQVKSRAIITCKHGIYELHQKLLVSSPPTKMKILLILVETESKPFPQRVTPH